VLLRSSWIAKRELAFEGELTFSVQYRGLVGLGLSPISWENVCNLVREELSESRLDGER
jgi:hypothetical protein